MNHHLMKLFPDQKRKIAQSSSDEQSQRSWSTRSMGDEDQKLFMYDDDMDSDLVINAEGEQDQLVEFFEVYAM